MNPLAHVIQCLLVGGLVGAVGSVLYALVRSDLRENPAKAKLPRPWAGTQEIRDYIAALDYSADDDEDEQVDDPGAEWDRARDLQIARQLGVA